MDKKKKQLGMNPSTASGKLIKDILFDLIVKTDQNYCFHCKEEITRETFSVEHKEPWLDSEDPFGLYFDIENIAFSHLSCNSGAARRNKSPCGTRKKYDNGCRCDSCTNVGRKALRDRYDSAKRRQKYLDGKG